MPQKSAEISTERLRRASVFGGLKLTAKYVAAVDSNQGNRALKASSEGLKSSSGKESDNSDLKSKSLSNSRSNDQSKKNSSNNSESGPGNGLRRKRTELFKPGKGLRRKRTELFKPGKYAKSSSTSSSDNSNKGAKRLNKSTKKSKSKKRLSSKRRSISTTKQSRKKDHIHSKKEESASKKKKSAGKKKKSARKNKKSASIKRGSDSKDSSKSKRSVHKNVSRSQNSLSFSASKSGRDKTQRSKESKDTEDSDDRKKSSKNSKSKSESKSSPEHTTPPGPILPTVTPTSQPTTNEPRPRVCNGLTENEREFAILTELSFISDPDLLPGQDTPQGVTTNWLLTLDEKFICPGDMTLVQRYVLGLLFFSTDGNQWDVCSPGDDGCSGSEGFPNADPWLSEESECDWAGIECNTEGLVSRIEIGKKSPCSVNIYGTSLFPCIQINFLFYQ